MKEWKVSIKVESNEGDCFAMVGDSIIIGNPLFFPEQVNDSITLIRQNLLYSINAVYGKKEEVSESLLHHSLNRSSVITLPSPEEL